VIKVLKAAFLRWFNGGVFSYAGALAYTTLFSLGPTLLLIVTIAGFFFGRKAAETRVFEEIQRLVGTEGAQEVCWLVCELDGVRVYQSGRNVIVSRADINP
jgi:membrane protein